LLHVLQEDEHRSFSFQEHTMDALISGFGTFKHRRLLEQGLAPDRQSCGPIWLMEFGMIKAEGASDDSGFGSPCDLSAGIQGCVPVTYPLNYCQRDLYAGGKDAAGGVIAPLTAHERRCCLALQLKSASTVAGRFSVKTFSQESVPEAISVWNPGCGDILGPQVAWGNNPAPYNNLLEGSMVDAIGLDCPADPASNFSGGRCPPEKPLCHQGACVSPLCSNVKQYCFEDTLAGTRARQFCSVTCGCADPFSELVLTAPEYGCPASCDRSVAYNTVMGSLPCADVSPNSAALQAWAQNATLVTKEWPTNWADGVAMETANVVRIGCSSIPFYREVGYDWCLFGGNFYPIKPLSYLCPVACGCRDPTRRDQMWGCPSSCALPAANTTAAA
jgi:hypothetical protein